ncbi:MAG: YtxH domain-containing protein [Bacteroidota bacterium]
MGNSNNTIKVIGAVALGAIVGAALGVLFAPDKGSNTRAKIAGGAKDLGEDVMARIKNEIAALRNKAEELEISADAKFEETLNRAKQIA